jgi:hypothetical protein
MTAVGEVIAGRYRLVDQIAVGGMGLVWEGWDELLLRRVAVKQLLNQPGLAEQDVVIARNRVIREARITARLHHPHAVTLFDVVDNAGYPCLIMQFVPSVSLSGLLHQQGFVPPTVATGIGADVASALVAAHAVGIVHRDVKPGNVLITDDGSAMITDFGISHAVGDITLTATGMVSGTPAYLAPEVARGGESGFPADVFSLGSTLYAALEGSPPFGTDPNPMAVLHRVASGRIDPPLRSGPLTPLLLRMLAPEPAARPPMLEVAQALAGRPLEIRTLQDVPPTAAISAQTLREPVGGRQHLAVAPTASSGPRVASTRPDGRRRPTGTVLVASVMIIVGLITLTGLLILRENTPPDAGATTTQLTTSSDRPPTARVTSAAGTAPSGNADVSSGPLPSVTTSTLAASPRESTTANEPSTATPQPATPGAIAPEQASAEPTTPVVAEPQVPPSSPPTAADLAAAVTDYYALMPTDTEEGWSRLTPNFQTSIAQDRAYYQAFWDGVRLVTATDITGIPPDQAEATLTYYFDDGRVSVERTTYRLVQDGGILKLDTSTVQSSQSG